MRTKDDQREYNSEEAKDVKNEDQPLESRKPSADDGIDRDAEHDDRPVEHDTMPWVRVICRISKNNQPSCHRPVEVSDRSAEGLPSEDCQPSYNSYIS